MIHYLQTGSVESEACEMYTTVSPVTQAMGIIGQVGSSQQIYMNSDPNINRGLLALTRTPLPRLLAPTFHPRSKNSEHFMYVLVMVIC